MTNPDEKQTNGSEPSSFEELGDGLRRLYGGGPQVPREVDDAVLAMARRKLGQPRRRIAVRAVKWASAAAAVAAVIIVALVLPLHGRNAHGPRATVSRGSGEKLSPEAPIFDRADVNRDGRVNVLDAFALARRIEARPAQNAIARNAEQYDLNGDGAVDRHDVDAIAMAAVRLGQGGTVR